MNDIIRWHVLQDAATLARSVAGRITSAANEAIALRGEFSIVLAGGSTPGEVYRLLADADTDWGCWQIFFGDERCLPPEHPDRNSAMAMRNWLEQAPVAPENIHPIPAELGAEAGARIYADTIRQALPFDVVLLGMGEDGHTASLFPGQTHDPAQTVHPVHDAPKPPPDRISLGLAALNDAESVLVLVAGSSKRNAIARWRQGEALPIAGIHGHKGVDVYLDAVAAVHLGEASA